jgi:TPR repeat protein
MRVLAVLSLALLLGACTPPPDPRITGGKTAAPAGPPVNPELVAGIKAYNVGDFQRALNDFRGPAERGNADAQFTVGLMYAEGQGVPRDYAQAAKWYEKAAAQNQPDALFALAKLYVIGGGVAPDSAKALELYGRAEQAYPAGEKRDAVAEQRLALEAVLNEPKTAANEPKPATSAPKTATTEPAAPKTSP